MDVLRFTTIDGALFMLGGISSATCCMVGGILADVHPMKWRLFGWILGTAGVAGIVTMVVILATHNPVAGGG